ncbi:MAG: hypothetical protein IJP43_01690 [Oscillospiraceae bacterium]|nr:hypothetical protein [Oscillospiraceae bacterium]
MADKVTPGPVTDDAELREAVCVHTDKIFDSCMARDCFEDLRVYLTEAGQQAVSTAGTVRARGAELLYVGSDIEPVQFNRGYYSVNLDYYYRVRGEAVTAGAPGVPFTGLAVWSKRVLLYGSEQSAKVFSSNGSIAELTEESLVKRTAPTCIVEAVEPIILDMKLVEPTAPPESEIVEVPASVAALFTSPLVTAADVRRVYCSLGQFSIVRLERASQLLMPVYDYCVPDKDCVSSYSDDACTLFGRIDFPVDEFFPPDTMSSGAETYRDAREATK